MTAFPRNNSLERVNEMQPALPDASAGAYAAPVETHRRNLLQAIWMRRWIVVFVTVLAIGAGVAQYFLTTQIFESRARVVVEQGGPKLINDPMGAAGVLSNYLNTQAEIMHSPVIMEAVAARPDIRDLKSLRGASNNITGA